MRSWWLTFLLLAASAAAQEAAPGTGRITGKVVGPLRAAAVGAEVWVENADGVLIARGRTDGSGFFVLSRLPWGHLHVRATMPGGNVGYEYLDLSAAVPEQFVRLRICDATRIRGTVVDGDGKPVAGAHVISEHDVVFDWYMPEFTARGVTDAQGRFELEPVLFGPTTVRAWAPGHVLGEQRLHVAADAAVDFRLTRGDGATLRLRLLGATPEQVADARIHASYQYGSRGRQLPTPLERASFDGAGVCLLAGLTLEMEVPSLYVEVPRSGVDPVRARLDSAAKSGQVHRTVEFRVLAQQQHEVRGQLLDRQRKPLARQRLVCSGGWPAPSTTTTTDDAGRFVLPTRMPADAAFGVRLASETLILDAEGDSRHRGVVDGRVAPERELALTAGPVARVTGRIVAADGNGMANVEVQLRKASSYYATQTTATDAAGRFTFTRLNGLAPYDFLVHVEEETGFAHGETFQLLDGGTREVAPLTLQPPSTIAGTVKGADGKPLPGARVVLRRCDAAGSQSDGFRIETVADRQGRFRFPGLEPRGWRLFHYELGQADKLTSGPWFELRTGTTENVVLEPAK